MKNIIGYIADSSHVWNWRILNSIKVHFCQTPFSEEHNYANNEPDVCTQRNETLDVMPFLNLTSGEILFNPDVYCANHLRMSQWNPGSTSIWTVYSIITDELSDVEKCSVNYKISAGLLLIIIVWQVGGGVEAAALNPHPPHLNVKIVSTWPG